MAAKTKAARRVCQHNRAWNQTVHDTHIITDYERGTMVAGVIIAISFGLMFVHAGVML